ncbi:MAG TPA: hypothetical protein ENL18_03400 [Thermoplasmatales archaeon]|nr:hypothetical protein [Thermoplasmatales archaeon]
MNKCGNFSRSVSVAIVLLMTFTAFSSVAIRGNSSEIVMGYYFERPVVGESIDMDGCNSYDFNGIKLPVKPLHILIPQGYRVGSVSVEKSGRVSLGVGHNLEKSGSLFALSSPYAGGGQVATGETGSTIPERDFITVGTYTFRGYSIFVMDICPARYVPGSGEIFYYRHMSVNIGLDNSNPSSFRGSEYDRDIVKGMVDNPGVLDTYRKSAGMGPSNSYDYIVITSNELKNTSGSYTFQTLVDSKISGGMTAEIVTVEEIVGNSSYWVNGTWGDNNPSNPFYNSEITGNFSKYNDTQAKIRNFIRYAYTDLGTKYVLLGGDADGGNKGNDIVPARRLYANETGLPLLGMPPSHTLGFEEDNIPSDLYYACLDGNFNYDMDDFWGENASRNGLADVDESDFYSEVWVGRACVDTADEISNFVMKTLAYENTNDPYTSDVLFLGEYLGFPGVSKYGGNYKDEVKPYVPSQYDVTTMYDRDWPGFDPNDPWATGWDKYDLMTVLNNDTPSIINHDGHGFVNYGLRLHNSDIDTLTNDRYFFVYSQTCLAGSFDNCYNEHYYTDDCAAEHFTVETPHGAFAAIMNARYGLGSEGTVESPSGYYDKSFFKALFSLGIKQIGAANQYSKEDNVWQINENGMRWACYETNLFGDPSLAIKQPNMGVSIVEPEKGFYLFGNGPLFPMSRTVSIGSITVKVNATALYPDSVDRVEFYVDDVLRSSDGQAPYEWKWDGFAMGTHTIKVTGYSKYGETDSDEMEIFIISR